MTLKEIAERAGVSVSTVSRIINSSDDSFARKSVRDTVWKIIKETGYVPNSSARALKQCKSSIESTPVHTISYILGRTKTLDENPFFAQTARAIEQQALNMGYVISSSYSILDLKDCMRLQKIEATGNAIVLGRFNRNTRQFLESHYKNIVYVGRNVIDAEWDQIVCDGYEATKTAVNHLISIGHTRIAYIGETEHEVRFQAFLETMKAHGLHCDKTYIASFAQDSAGGYLGAEYLLQHANPLPTALFCATDITAVATVKKLLEAGIKIPEQISVISMDDIEIAQYISPMLTTVSMPKIEMGRLAVRTLIDRVNKGHRLPVKIFLPHKLILRESTQRNTRP